MSEKYLTVTALTKYIKRKIDTDPHLRDVWLKGEISNFKHHSRGHMYLTIKDDQTRIQAVMFAGNNRRLKFTPENGMKVLLRGEISVFESNGQYQLYIQQMEPDGIGSLYLAFEQLKEKLRKQGYFEEVHKKAIPLFPKSIGIITSPTGAAVRDIITTIKRRYPVVQATVIPVLVQGSSAAESIRNAIEVANEKVVFDVLIIGRGGGSIEELWSFNEEVVADAIFRSKIPIISAVGHETDTTISDYVADLRAPTPTGAAELAVPSIVELRDKVTTQKRQLTRALNVKLDHHNKMLQRLVQSYAFRYPKQMIQQREQQLDKLQENLFKYSRNHVSQLHDAYKQLSIRLHNQHPKKQLEQAKKDLLQLRKQSISRMSQIVEKNSINLKQSMEKLSLLNPLEIMKRGFAIPYNTDGNIIKTTTQVSIDDKISIEMKDGKLECQVLQIEEGSRND
ncbi:exodeoxyribonuclease VII large subunit [Ornithinibacillus sp. L9]|uniref:Exodeoxyribonuclease 7 large subunit n=1 Tax=Ornithinibacillus caprae TaxID=2678566 RepID=A0A6N8FDB8_9BACI|nr:exodeoxyribonuclease VII large subunit [Ornithinibacillus caprae]MUK87171.1 exodeoxyribonuclease VII large subunit [Ornithinibacillus caprae]